MDGFNGEHKADHVADFMDSIIRACCLCSSSLSLSLSLSLFPLSLNSEGDFMKHNLNLYRAGSR